MCNMGGWFSFLKMTKALSVSRVPGAVDSTVFFSKSSKGGTLRAAFIVCQHLLNVTSSELERIWLDFVWFCGQTFSESIVFSAPSLWLVLLHHWKRNVFVSISGSLLGLICRKAKVSWRRFDQIDVGWMWGKTLQPLGADFQGKNFFQPWAVGVANLGPQKTWPIFLGAELAMASVVWSQTYNRTCINCNKGWNPQFSTLWFFRRTGRVCIFQADKHETYTSATVNRQFMAAKLPYFPRQGHGVELPI